MGRFSALTCIAETSLRHVAACPRAVSAAVSSRKTEPAWKDSIVAGRTHVFHELDHFWLGVITPHCGIAFVPLPEVKHIAVPTIYCTGELLDAIAAIAHLLHTEVRDLLA